VLVHALVDSDEKLSSVHGTASLLLTALRPGVRALDRQADPVKADRRAGDSAAAGSSGKSADGAIRHIAVKSVREIREQFGSAAGIGR
jgi:hypothetical protein